MPFTNTDGKTEQVSVNQIPGGANGDSVYIVRVGDDQFSVTVEAGSNVNAEDVLAQVIDSYSETPEELRDGLHQVYVKKGPDPDGALATTNAQDGIITFYGEDTVTEDIFHHEMGHIISLQVDTGKVPGVPEGWNEAAAADGNHLNPYTKESHDKSGTYTEDFAEAWSEYMRALDAGPKALSAFEKMYPERAKILEELYPPPA